MIGTANGSAGASTSPRSTGPPPNPSSYVAVTDNDGVRLTDIDDDGELDGDGDGVNDDVDDTEIVGVTDGDGKPADDNTPDDQPQKPPSKEDDQLRKAIEVLKARAQQKS